MGTPVLVNLGSGPHVADGWIAIDASWNAWLAQWPGVRRVMRALGLLTAEHDSVGWPAEGIRCLDVRRGLPFADASVHGIFAAHFLEHLTPDEVAALLREAHRVLAPGGVIRVIVPDLAWMCGAYQRSLESADGEVRALAASRFLRALNLDGFRTWPAGLAWALARRVSRTGHRALYDRHALSAALELAGFREAGVRAFGDGRLPLLDRVERPDHHDAAICVEAIR